MIYNIDEVLRKKVNGISFLKCICIRNYLDFKNFDFEKGSEYIYYKDDISISLIVVYDDMTASIGISEHDFDEYFLDYRDQKINNIINNYD